MTRWITDGVEGFDRFQQLLKSTEAKPHRATNRPARPAPPPPAPPRQPVARKQPHIFRHGDIVRFRHGRVEGTGKLVTSSMSSVTVKTDDGVEHHMRHEALIAPE